MGNIDKIYRVSRIHLAFLAFVIVFLCVDEKAPLACFIFLPIGFGLITYLISFLTSIISKKMFFTGNKIKNIFFKVMYYIGILIVACLGFIVSYLIFEIILYERDFSTLMTNAINKLIIDGIILIGIILPYFQTLNVLILHNVLLKDNNKNIN